MGHNQNPTNPGLVTRRVIAKMACNYVTARAAYIYSNEPLIKQPL